LAYFVAECRECGQKVHLRGGTPQHPKRLRNLCSHINPNGFEVEKKVGGGLIIKSREVR